MTIRINPLPRLGRCPHCEGEIRLRGNGTLYRHENVDDFRTVCPGSWIGPTEVLEPTFARWVYTHRNLRDWRDNGIAKLAQEQFVGCTQSAPRTPADITWTTAEQLHDRLHQWQKAATGPDVRQPYDGQRCDWACRQVLAVGAIHAALRLVPAPADRKAS